MLCRKASLIRWVQLIIQFQFSAVQALFLARLKIHMCMGGKWEWASGPPAKVRWISGGGSDSYFCLKPFCFRSAEQSSLEGSSACLGHSLRRKFRSRFSETCRPGLELQMSDLEFNSSQISECPNLRFSLWSLLGRTCKAEVSASFWIDVYLEIFYFSGFCKKLCPTKRFEHNFYTIDIVQAFKSFSFIFFFTFVHVGKSNSSKSTLKCLKVINMVDFENMWSKLVFS